MSSRYQDYTRYTHEPRRNYTQKICRKCGYDPLDHPREYHCWSCCRNFGPGNHHNREKCRLEVIKKNMESLKRKREYFEDLKESRKVRYINPNFDDSSKELSFIEYNDKSYDKIPESKKVLNYYSDKQEESLNKLLDDSIKKNSDQVVVQELQEPSPVIIPPVQEHVPVIPPQPIISNDPLSFFVDEVRMARMHIARLSQTCYEQEEYIKELEEKLEKLKE